MPDQLPNLDLDQDQINNLRLAFDNDIKEFIQQYCQDFELKQSALFESIQQKQDATVAQIAHTLKGNSANVGARGLAKICESIEKSAKNNDYDGMLHAYKALNDLYPLFKTAILKL